MSEKGVVVKKPYACQWPGCSNSYARSEHLNRHRLNRESLHKNTILIKQINLSRYSSAINVPKRSYGQTYSFDIRTDTRKRLCGSQLYIHEI